MNEPNQTNRPVKPIFLVGCERSGTTMLRLMLNNHPQIAFHFEFDFVVTGLPHTGFPEMQKYRAALLKDRIFTDSNFQIDSSLSYEATVNSFLMQVMHRENKPLVGAKIHHAFDRLPDVWPDCRIIHIIRDPRDVARSIVNEGWEGNVWCAAKWWKDAEETWDRLRSRLAPENFLELKFGELVSDPKSKLEGICRFLGIDYSDEMMRYSERSKYDKPDVSLSQQWKIKLTHDGIALVEAQVGGLLEIRGYQRAVCPARNPSVMRKRLLQIQSRLGKLRFRIRRFGLWLTMEESYARKFGSESQNQRVREKIWAVQRRFLK